MYIYKRDKPVKISNKKSTKMFERRLISKGVRYHCGGWSEEVNSCILISYMVYL
jgi:hypothetical protein